MVSFVLWFVFGSVKFHFWFQFSVYRALISFLLYLDFDFPLVLFGLNFSLNFSFILVSYLFDFDWTVFLGRDCDYFSDRSFHFHSISSIFVPIRFRRSQKYLPHDIFKIKLHYCGVHLKLTFLYLIFAGGMRGGVICIRG